MLMGSKNCSRKVLPRSEQQVSTKEALPARDKEAALRPRRARCHRFEVPGALRAWRGRYGMGCTATRACLPLPTPSPPPPPLTLPN